MNEDLKKKEDILLAKLYARRETHYAIQQGWLIKQPCRACDAKRVEAHHLDYSKPYEVLWLCKECHTAYHYYREYAHLYGGDLTDLQYSILNYLHADTAMVNLPNIVRDCNALNIDSAALAIATLLVKGYLQVKPLSRPPVENSQEIVDFLRESLWKKESNIVENQQVNVL